MRPGFIPRPFYWRIGMLKRVIAYPNGQVNLYYSDRVVSYFKDKDPIVKMRTYSKKDVYELNNNFSNISNDSTSLSWNKLSDGLPTIH
jgi:hypothetical protein